MVGIVSLLTVAVSLIGYGREAALAARFGLSSVMDAYFAAIFIPNTIFFILIPGTLSPVFIPILMEEHGLEDRERGSMTFSVITNFAIVVMIAILGTAMLTARYWMTWLFPGFDPQTSDLSIRLTQMILPAVLFLALGGILTALLNGFHRFALAAFAPALSSLTIIAAVMFARGPNAIYIVGLATVLGFFAQFAILVPAVRRLGVRYRPFASLRHPAVRKLIQLGMPLVIYLALANISGFFERNLASRFSAGAVSAISYALRLFNIPANFLAAPLATVAYPQLAHEAANERFDSVRDRISHMFRLVMFLFLPITAWVALNALPLTKFVYERGHFTTADSLLTARLLMLYSLGILPVAMAVVMLRALYAVQDTMTPMIAQAIDLGFYIAIAFWMTHTFGLEGLAIARAGSFLLVTLILVYVLIRHRKLLHFDAALLGFIGRICVATAGLGLVTWGALTLLAHYIEVGHTAMRFGVICVSGAGGFGAYLLLAHVLKVEESRQVVQTVFELGDSAFRRYFGALTAGDQD
jgi:putative peptidoglycan lipid II flippase